MAIRRLEYRDIDMRTIIVDGEDATFEPMIAQAVMPKKAPGTKKDCGEFDLCGAYANPHHRPTKDPAGSRPSSGKADTSGSSVKHMSASELFKAGCEEALAVATDTAGIAAMPPEELADIGLEFMGADTKLVEVLAEIHAEIPPAAADADDEDAGDLFYGHFDAGAGDPGIIDGIVVAAERPWYSIQREIMKPKK